VPHALPFSFSFVWSPDLRSSSLPYYQTPSTYGLSFNVRPSFTPIQNKVGRAGYLVSSTKSAIASVVKLTRSHSIWGIHEVTHIRW
jgi:hypothetical protein